MELSNIYVAKTTFQSMGGEEPMIEFDESILGGIVAVKLLAFSYQEDDSRFNREEALEWLFNTYCSEDIDKNMNDEDFESLSFETLEEYAKKGNLVALESLINGYEDNSNGVSLVTLDTILTRLGENNGN